MPDESNVDEIHEKLKEETKPKEKIDETRQLDNWLKTYLECTVGQETPQLFHLWGGLATLAGAVRNNIYVDWDWKKLFPNLYVLIVAPTGHRKGMSLGVSLEMLYQIPDINILHEKASPEGIIRALARRKIEKDKAEEKVIQFKIKSSYIFIAASEFANLMSRASYMNGMMELLTSLYDGHARWDYSKSKERVDLKDISVNMFALSNPEWLAVLGQDSAGGGFLSRFLPIYSEEIKEAHAWPKMTNDQKIKRQQLVIDLLQIAKVRGEFKITKEALDYYEDWYVNTWRFKEELDFDGPLLGYGKRKQDYIVKISMLLSIARNSKLIIEIEDIKKAMSMLKYVESRMKRAFAYVGATNEAKIANRILEKLIGRKPLTHEQIIRFARTQVRNIRELENILQMLESAELIEKVVPNTIKNVNESTLFWRATKKAVSQFR